MVVLKTIGELNAQAKACRLSAQALELGGELVKPGVTTGEIDRGIAAFIKKSGGKASFLGYGGFPGSSCVSVNDEVIHGIPGKRVLREGDVVSIDVGVLYGGFHGDNAYTFPVGKVHEDTLNLLEATKQSLEAAIQAAQPGNRIGDVGAAVQQYVESRGYSVVKEYVGHGVGRQLHESPEVPNYGKPGHGVRLLPGMVIAIEPMINLGGASIRVLHDKWTVVTCDGKPSAHFEHTVAITAGGPVVMTKTTEVRFV